MCVCLFKFSSIMVTGQLDLPCPMQWPKAITMVSTEWVRYALQTKVFCKCGAHTKFFILAVLGWSPGPYTCLGISRPDHQDLLRKKSKIPEKFSTLDIFKSDHLERLN